MIVSVSVLRRTSILMAVLIIAVAISACTGGGEIDSANESTESPSGSDTSAGGKTRTVKGSAEAPPGSANKDKSALIAVLDALNARPSWADSGQTLNEVPPEERTGIFTNEGGRVVGLLLSNSLLSGELPPEVGDLAALRWLDLSANQISGELPPELGNLANLEGLIVSHNLLTGALPLKLGDLPALEVMDLSHN